MMEERVDEEERLSGMVSVFWMMKRDFVGQRANQMMRMMKRMMRIMTKKAAVDLVTFALIVFRHGSEVEGWRRI